MSTVSAFPWLNPGWAPPAPTSGPAYTGPGRPSVGYPTSPNPLPRGRPIVPGYRAPGGPRAGNVAGPANSYGPSPSNVVTFDGNLAQRINQFIAATHPNAPLAGKGAMLVRVGRRWGVDPRVLAIIARKESEFGTTSGKFKNNAWGWGVHFGPDVNTAPSWEAMANRVAKGLTGELYRGAGKNTLESIIMRYAPPSENNTREYIQQISNWYRTMGGKPGQSVWMNGMGAAGGTVWGGSAPGDDLSGDPGSVAVGTDGTTAPTEAAAPASFEPIMVTPGRVFLNPGSLKAIEGWRAKTDRQMMQGENIDTVDAILPKLKFDLVNPVWSGGQQVTTGGDVSPVAGGPAASPSPAQSASPAAPPSTGGGWGGTYKPATVMRDIALSHGLSVSSEKRNRQSTASGGVSDHWSGSKQSYAYDLAWGSDKPTNAADRAASEIVRRLGGPADWGKTGGNFTKTVNGIRWQVLYRTDIGGNHWDHIHVGARRA
jgi:hypothetical protein